MSVPCTCNFLEVSTGHAPDCPSFSHAPAPSAAHAGLLARADAEKPWPCCVPAKPDSCDCCRLLALIADLAAALRAASPSPGAVEAAAADLDPCEVTLGGVAWCLTHKTRRPCGGDRLREAVAALTTEEID